MGRGVGAQAVAATRARRRRAARRRRPRAGRPSGSSSTVEAACREPLDVERRLGLALGWRKRDGHELRAVHDAGVGREDEVGHVRVRGPGSRPRRRPPAAWPPSVSHCSLRLVAVDLDLAVHPRVDLVEHAEVRRRAHQEARPHDSPRHVRRAEFGGEVADEEADVGDDAEGLVAAAIGELGDDGLVDVDAEGLDTGGQDVARGDGVQRRGQHQRDADARHEVAHGVGRLDDVGSSTSGSGPSSRSEPASTNGTSWRDALVHHAAVDVAGLDRGGDRAVAPHLVDDAQVVGVAALGRAPSCDRDAERRAEHVATRCRGWRSRCRRTARRSTRRGRGGRSPDRRRCG